MLGIQDGDQFTHFVVTFYFSYLLDHVLLTFASVLTLNLPIFFVLKKALLNITSAANIHIHFLPTQMMGFSCRDECLPDCWLLFL